MLEFSQPKKCHSRPVSTNAVQRTLPIDSTMWGRPLPPRLVLSLQSSKVRHGAHSRAMWPKRPQGEATWAGHRHSRSTVPGTSETQVWTGASQFRYGDVELLRRGVKWINPKSTKQSRINKPVTEQGTESFGILFSPPFTRQGISTYMRIASGELSQTTTTSEKLYTIIEESSPRQPGVQI